MRSAQCAWCTSIEASTPHYGQRLNPSPPRIGCVPQTLHEWVKRAEVATGVREGVTTNEAQRVKDLEREVRELRRANEILKLASAFFAQAEPGRRLKS